MKYVLNVLALCVLLLLCRANVVALVRAYAGVAARICSDDASAILAAVSPRLVLPIYMESYVRRFVTPVRSAAQDAVAASRILLDGLCFCSESASGAVADARLGRA